MITIQNTFDAEGSYPLARLGDPASLLFFDIETTGFSGDFCTVYLIGCVFYKEGRAHFIQWFADTKAFGGPGDPELFLLFKGLLRPGPF